ncbi:MAG: hypothetical protein CVV64_16890 [Candidatus Wallbacteria bacterium HGW-Wallbacteria-1]|jgi:hypothetical protein|uniref:4Fe-4S ferredoxin-type domain-containing protein n=1 Tax=Candidatus Wallbacteria bacterium HGW-Wallbacteria-1 TaxID=2013854 RepID=A0A2N1PKK7_9BACT|nr:MAG: hypothetical protein CVV64_16890 [Candidatus Wallbacteria bacterium HGW-Wallbacteria-1]
MNESREIQVQTQPSPGSFPSENVTRIALSIGLMEWFARGWFGCPFAVPYLSCSSCPVTNCPGTWMQAFTAPLILIFALFRSRFFCNRACPLGLFLDHLPCFRRKREPEPSNPAQNHVVPNNVTRPFALRNVSAMLPMLLLISVVGAWITYDTSLISDNRLIRSWDYVVRNADPFSPESLNVAIDLGLKRYSVRLGLGILIIITSIGVRRRFWCSFICPLGTLQTVIWKFRKKISA